MIAIRNGHVLTLDENDQVFQGGDVLVEGGRITYVGPRLEAVPEGAQVIDASEKLLMPGLIVGHAHSNELLVRGMLDNMPLNLWGLYCMPPIDYGPFSERLIYLRTMLGAIEMLKNGITTVQDDLSETPRTTMEGTRAARRAYVDSGMRAYVTLNQGTAYGYDEHPYLKDILPKSWIAKMSRGAPIQGSELIALYKDVIAEWHGAANGRMGVTLSFSAPQRAAPNYLQALNKLSEERNLPLHMHILETKPQRVAGQVWYGKSQVKYAHDLGLVTRRATIIHSVWVDDEDMAIMGQARASVAHNPISNLKLISGIMPYRRMVKAGVNVTLGTDGASSNDSFNLFFDMRVAALIHKLTSPSASDWPTAREVLGMATLNGAYSMMMDHEVGRLARGYKADIVMLDLRSTSFTPLNDPIHHLVYCESGASVDTVMVDGEVVVRGRKLQKVDEDALLQELREHNAEHTTVYEKARKYSEELSPYYEEMVRRAMAEDVGMDRFAFPRN